MKKSEKMLVLVELRWGSKWNGTYYEPTPGVGVDANVSEHFSNCKEGGFSFSGCPLGRTTGMGFTDDAVAIDYAIRDFVNYGRYEYKGLQPLTRDMIVVVETRDWRKKE